MNILNVGYESTNYYVLDSNNTRRLIGPHYRQAELARAAHTKGHHDLSRPQSRPAIPTGAYLNDR